MNVYGFLRLFWRPMALVIPLFGLFVAGQVEVVYLISARVPTQAAPIEIFGLGSDSIGMVLVALLPGLAGLWVSRAIEEIRNRRFAYMLPGRDRILRLGVVGMGLLFSAVTAAIHALAWGGLGALPLGSVALAWFSLTATRAPMSLPSPWQSKAHNWTIAIGTVAWLVAADRVATVVVGYPLLVTAAPVIISVLLFRGAFSRNAARRRAGQMILLFADYWNSARYKHFTQLRVSARDWSTIYLGDNLWDWVRARFYEQNFRRLVFLFPPAVFLFYCLLMGVPPVPVEVGWSDALNRPGEWAARVWSLSMGIDSRKGLYPAYMFLILPPLFHMYWLGKNSAASNLRRLHSVSRVRRAQIAFWFYLAQSGTWCFTLIAGVLFIGITAGLIGGSHPLLPGIPLPVLHCSVLVLAVAPLVQALPMCPPGGGRQLLGGLVLCAWLGFFMAPVIALLLEAKTEFLTWYSRLEAELWVLPLLAVLTQGLFHRWLQSHYRRCDLN